MVRRALVRLLALVDAVPAEGPVVAEGVRLLDDAVEAVQVEGGGVAARVRLDALALRVAVAGLPAPGLAR